MGEFGIGGRAGTPGGTLTVDRDNFELARLIVDNIDYGVMLVDRALDVSFINPALRAWFGFPDDFLSTPKSFAEAVRFNRHNRIYPIADEDFDAFVEQRVADIRAGGIEPVDLHLQDGRSFRLRIVDLPDGGRLLTYYDITEQVRQRAELEREKAMLDTILSSLDQGVTYYDTDLTLIKANHRFFEILDLPPESCGPGTNLEVHFRYNAERGDFGDIGNVDDFIEQRLAMVRQFKPHHAERTRPNGMVIDIRGKPIDGGGFVSTYTDISALKRSEAALREAKEEAEAATRAKSDFLANMSHEIRTPLNAVLGLTKLLLASALTDDQRQLATKVEASGQLLLGVINDILDMSKIEAGKLEIERLPFDLEALLRNVVSVIAPRVRAGDVELLLSMAADVPSKLTGDALRLSQVLINLGSNAAKFTEIGDILLDVSVQARRRDEVVLRFRLTDSGIGLTPEQRARLFQSFSQADTSTTRRYGGTGLGLSISKALVEMMGGTIGVESEYGRGSTFWFEVPFGLATEPEAFADVVPPDLRGLRVLILDNNAVARDALLQTVTGLGFHAVTVETLEDTVAALERPGEPFSVLMLDYKLTTPEAVERIRKSLAARPAGAAVPTMILMTAHDESSAAEAAARVALDGSVVKAATASQIFDTLMNAFGRRSARAGFTSVKLGAEVGDALQGARILVVEDNEINQLVARGLLQQVGVEIAIANNGKEAVMAVEAVAPDYYDAVLMDLQMPEMDGVAATRAIRAIPALNALPIIAMTAHAFQNERHRCFAAGMVDYVTKPVNPDRLFHVLCNHIQVPEQRRIEAVSSRNKAARSRNADPDILPDDLAGIDVRSALTRVGGNRRLLRRLLEEFASKDAAMITRMRTAIMNNALGEAGSLAHGLKGVAGNVGANSAFEAAKNVERTCKNNDVDAAMQWMDQLEAAVFQVRQVVEHLIGREEAGTPPDQVSARAPAAFSRAAVLLADIEALAEASDAAALDHFDDLSDLIGGAPGVSLIALETALNEFDFETAVTEAAALRGQLESRA